jgi:hypothetical protein
VVEQAVRACLVTLDFLEYCVIGLFGAEELGVRAVISASSQLSLKKFVF